MSQYAFGTGSLWGTATQDAQGNTIAVPVPVKFGELQDISLDMARDLKPLYGQNMMPVAIGGGKMKFDFKAKFARISGRLFNDLFFGNALTTGTLQGVYNDVTGSVIPTTPFTITPTIPSSGTYVRDLGVMDANGVPMTKVASGPTTGQYSQSAGVYTFATADVGKTVFISFAYSAAAAGSQKITLTNQPMGACPVFGIDLAIAFNGKQFNWRFPNCVATKLSFDPKQDDFTENNLDISAFADATGNIGYLVTAE